MANGASTEEQTCLKECVGEDVEHRWQPSASAETHHHVAQLRDRRVRKHLLDVVLNECQCSGNDNRDATNQNDEVHAVAVNVHSLVEHWVHTSDQENTGNHHGG